MKSILVSFVLVGSLAASSVLTCANELDVFVSSTGTDTGACLRTAPCASFAYAFTQTTWNSVIHVVDAGAYGTVAITHGITIDGGGLASSMVGGGGSIQEASVFRIAAGASDVVTIENLTISGVSGFGAGVPSAIAVTTAGAVHVEHCTFAGFSSAAIDFRATGALLDMKDVTITDLANGDGVYVANARATLDHVSISHTQTAVLAAGSSSVTIAHSTANGNGSGFVAAYGPTAEIHVDDCAMTNNQWAIVAGQGAKAYVSRSSLFNNFISALFNDGSSFLLSYGDNRFAGNASDGAFTSTVSVK
jgi:hypothetical protein